MRLRVATICSYYPPQIGGIASQVQAVAKALGKCGVESHIITRDWRLPNGEAAVEIEDENVIVHRIALDRRRWRASPSFAWQIAARVRDLRPDLIHAHELLLPTTAALLAKSLTGRPVVATAHTSGPELGECARLQRAAFGRQRVRYVRVAVDHFVAISSAVDSDMHSIGIESHKRALIPDGIDMEQFRPVGDAQKQILRQDLGLPAGRLVVYTGRLSPEKRVLALACEWPAVRAIHQDAWLVVVGDGEQFEDLRHLSSHGIFLAGAQREVAPYLQAADLFVMPSVSEGFSISTLEGLASGLPVAAARVGAIPDLVLDGRTGRLVAPDDMPALRNAICELLASQSAWQAMGEVGRCHVVQRYSTQAVAQRLTALYQRLLEQRS